MGSGVMWIMLTDTRRIVWRHDLYNYMPIPANSKRSANVGTMLAHRLRRWPNIVPVLAERSSPLSTKLRQSFLT